jgi:inhibitor of KinA
MNKYDLTFKSYGDKAILIEWPNRIDDNILDDIILFVKYILPKEENNLANYTSGYNSILLQYHSIIDLNEKKKFLSNLYNTMEQERKLEPKSWRIPVCYDESFGLDLQSYTCRGMSQENFIRLHTSKPFRVYMIGFLPGFFYLGGLPKLLHMKRKNHPRPHVHKGSIAIGGEQTGIYPMDSPGGWNIIGRTPLTLFDINKKEPTHINQGDYIHFYSIDIIDYQNLSTH